MNLELVQQLNRRDDTIERIKATCTPAEIAAVINSAVGHQAVKIPGTVDTAKIAVFKLTPLQIGVLLVYAHTIKSQGSKNKFDALSHASENVKEITISTEKITFHEDEDRSINTYDGIVGGHSLGTLAAGAVGCTVRKIKDGDAKAVTYHAKNDLVMGEAKAGLLSALVTTTVNDVDSAAQVAKEIDQSDPESQMGVITLLNQVVPTPILTADGKAKKTPLYHVRPLKKEGDAYKTYPNSTKLLPPSVAYHTRSFCSALVQGEYPAVAEECSKYHMGLSLPTLRRVGRNMWLGVPLREGTFEHVIALHDAGVKVGSRILVKTADMVLISLLRSNFGGSIWGIGTAPGMIPQANVGNFFYDYVYYPKPIVCGYTGGVDHTFSTAAQQIQSMMLAVKGKVIMHISPILLYCEEILNFLGHRARDVAEKPTNKANVSMRKDFVKLAKTHAPIAVDDIHVDLLLPIYDKKYEEVFKMYGDRLLNKLPCVLPEKLEDETDEEYAIKQEMFAGLKGQIAKTQKKQSERASLHATWGGIYDTFEEATVYEALPYCQIKNIVTNLHPTQLSYQGTLLYVEGKDGLVIEEALGMALVMMRHCHKSAWVLTTITSNTYRLRRIVKEAMLDQLSYDDEYSAIYSAEARHELILFEQDVMTGQRERVNIPDEQNSEYVEGRNDGFDYCDG